MKKFKQTLQDSGYRQFYLSFGDANLRFQDWPRTAKDISGSLLDLVKLFLFQQPVPRKRVTELMGEDCIAELAKCGILMDRANDVISDSYFLIYCRGHVMFCQMKSNPWAYFGDDSLALATYQSPAPGGSVLDLCSGPGIQSFVAATYAGKVTGVEIRKETWRIAEINRRLNDPADRITFVCNSAEGFAKSTKEKFDRILFNPPLVPMVPGYKFAFVGNGGGDGLDVTRSIFDLYNKRITETGCIEFIGVDLGLKDRKLVCEQVRALAKKHGMSGRIHILSQHPIRPFAPLFEASVFSLAKDNGLDTVEARKILADHFKKLKADAYWLFFASLGRPRGVKPNTVATVDVSKSFWGHWFV
jgi:methylase of polypeptide subunit release factors